MTKTELQSALAEATQTDKKTTGVFLDTLSAIAYKATKENGESKVSYRLQLIGWCPYKLSRTVLFDNHSKRRWP